MEKNLRKSMWFAFFQRRNFYPILALYFLTLPGALAQQIGIYTAIGTAAGFLIEIPSGYLSDRLGHKKVLVMARLSMLFSTFCFLIGSNFWWFVLGSIGISFGFAFSSGTHDAFIHETLMALKRGKEFSKIRARISANASLISGTIIIALPFLTSITIILPLLVTFITDIAGLFVSLSFVSPPQKLATFKSWKALVNDIKRAPKAGFYPIVFFTGFISACLLTVGPYKEPLLRSVGLPLVLVGITMGLSRYVWFIIGHNIEFFERLLRGKRLFIFEGIFFPLFIILMAVSKQPYFILGLYVLMLGYRYGRESIIVDRLIHRITNERYKATMLSVHGQMNTLLSTIIIIPFAFVMGVSIPRGFLVTGIFLFVTLWITYVFIFRTSKA